MLGRATEWSPRYNRFRGHLELSKDRYWQNLISTEINSGWKMNHLTWTINRKNNGNGKHIRGNTHTHHMRTHIHSDTQWGTLTHRMTSYYTLEEHKIAGGTYKNEKVGLDSLG